MGAEEQVTALLRRDPAARAPLDNLAAVAGLLDALRRVGAEEQVTVLADRAAAYASLDNPVAVAGLLDKLQAMGAEEQVTALADRAAVNVSLDNPLTAANLLDKLQAMGAEEQVTALLRRDPVTRTSFDNPYAVAGLLDSLRRVGAEQQVTALLHRDPAARAPLDNPAAVAGLLDALRRVARRSRSPYWPTGPPPASLDNPVAAAGLLDSLEAAGAEEQVTALADRAAVNVSLDNPATAARLLDKLRAMGAEEQVTALLHRDPAARARLDNPAAVAGLLDSLRAAGAEKQVTVLADRAAAFASLGTPDARLIRFPWPRCWTAWRRRARRSRSPYWPTGPPPHPLDNPYAVAGLLDKLRAMGAEEQVTALLHRDPAHALASITRLPWPGCWTPAEVGAEEQITALLHRDPAAHAPLDDPVAAAFLLGQPAESRRGAAGERTGRTGCQGAALFWLFLQQPGLVDQFRSNGSRPTPAAPWSWEDLDLGLFLHRGDRRHRRSTEQRGTISVSGAETEDDPNNRRSNHSGRLFEAQLAGGVRRTDQSNGTTVLYAPRCRRPGGDDVDPRVGIQV